MAQVSTGMRLAILGGCILGAAALTSHKFGSEAMAQGTGTDRRIVSAGVYVATNKDFGDGHFAYRIWSDNAIDVRCLGVTQTYMGYGNPNGGASYRSVTGSWLENWQTLDNGTSGFRPLTDVDMSGETDAGDISAVLLDFGATTDNPPPPIDCTINAPR